jgi:hypothetical protein
MLMSTLIGTCFFFALANASLHANVKRRQIELRNSYDFVIAGGGTSGLTVADRLSEALPNSTPALTTRLLNDGLHSAQRRSLSLSMVNSNMQEVSSTHQTPFSEVPALHRDQGYLTSGRYPIQM